MKVPFAWLKEWIDVPWDAATVGRRLTMAGIELESSVAAAPAFSGVVVAEILAVERHPNAEKLSVCRVAAGPGDPLQIVCGAPNARAGLKSALATIGARLPAGVTIKAAKLRGIESAGMLCSSRELGLAEGPEGILELPADAPVGASLVTYLQLDDLVLDFNVTPNRGDALSILGIAREVAALSGQTLAGPALQPVHPARADVLPVAVAAPDACPRFAGCVLRGLDNRTPTPPWISERLRRVGIRSISLVVDITNYVMIELGQPMHAYDLAKLQDGIEVRWGREGESVRLLDGREAAVGTDVLVICDSAGPVGLAGIMGGERTAVSAETRDIFLEVAYFAPPAVMGRALRWGLTTDASQRFERGVDPQGQERALARAVQLIQSIAGGAAGPVAMSASDSHRPQRTPVILRREQLAKVLGIRLADAQVESTLRGLSMDLKVIPDGWQITAPSYRFDIALEVDLIEEIARIVGYETIPEDDAIGAERVRALPEREPAEQAVLEVLAMRGYHEAVCYAFVDPQLQQQLLPDTPALALSNPIASDLSVMRISLWPGLLKAALENQRRQRERIRLFEHGARFECRNGATQEIDTLAGIVCGARWPEQWGAAQALREPADFFDVKGDLQGLFAALSPAADWHFEPQSHPGLHPQRSARLMRGTQAVGWLGVLHPVLVRRLEFVHAPVLFEIDWAALGVDRPQYQEISRQPQVRRDIAFVVDESVPLSRVLERVTLSASSLLRDLRVFDVYQGRGIEAGRKSIALGLIFQDFSRTLTDDEVVHRVAAVLADLRETFNANIRE